MMAQDDAGHFHGHVDDWADIAAATRAAPRPDWEKSDFFMEIPHLIHPLRGSNQTCSCFPSAGRKILFVFSKVLHVGVEIHFRFFLKASKRLVKNRDAKSCGYALCYMPGQLWTWGHCGSVDGAGTGTRPPPPPHPCQKLSTNFWVLPSVDSPS